MLENRTAAVAKSSPAARRPGMNRSRITNDPLSRADGRTAAGRRVRDLYRAFVAGAGNPDSDVFRAAALAAAELMAASEVAGAKLLSGDGDVEQIVRLENSARRAICRLGLRPGATKPMRLREYLQARQATQEAS
jgi:hypothetical protein